MIYRIHIIGVINNGVVEERTAPEGLAEKMLSLVGAEWAGNNIIDDLDFEWHSQDKDMLALSRKAQCVFRVDAYGSDDIVHSTWYMQGKMHTRFTEVHINHEFDVEMFSDGFVDKPDVHYHADKIREAGAVVYIWTREDVIESADQDELLLIDDEINRVLGLVADWSLEHDNERLYQCILEALGDKGVEKAAQRWDKEYDNES